MRLVLGIYMKIQTLAPNFEYASEVRDRLESLN